MNWKGTNKLISYLFVEGVLIFAFLMLLQVDWIVNSVLYGYDLKYSPVWAGPYRTLMWIIMSMLGLALVVTAVLGYAEYSRVKRLSKMAVYICESCGNFWTRGLVEPEIGKGKESKIKMIKSCPLCNKKLLDK